MSVAARKGLRYFFSLESAVDEGFDFQPPRPWKNPFREIGKIYNGTAKGYEDAPAGIRHLLQLQNVIGRDTERPYIALSPERRKQLLDESAQTTPRNVARAVCHVLSRYVIHGSWKERTFAAGLLGTTLMLNREAVEMTVHFSQWIGMVTNTLTAQAGAVMAARPEFIADIIGNYPLLQDILAQNPLLNETMMTYPDVNQILNNPDFQELISDNLELRDALSRSPTMDDLFMQFPAFAEQVKQTPELLEQLKNFNSELGGMLYGDEDNISKRMQFLGLAGGQMIENFTQAVQTFTSEGLQANFNAASDYFTSGRWAELNAEGKRDSLMNWHLLFDEQTRRSFSNLWNSRDFATIAAKFSAFMIISLKATQYMVLRWRGWHHGYMAAKATTDKAYMRIKNSLLNTIENPGQRMQEDPDKFTTAAASIITGFVTAVMTFDAFGRELLKMGPLMGVEGGYLWATMGYAALLFGATMIAGWQLPEIYRNKQRVEANLRRSTDNIDNQADQIALTDNEANELEEMRRRTKPPVFNSVRELGVSVRMILVDATFGNFSTVFPRLLLGFSVIATGGATIGTVAAFNQYYNRVFSAMSFFTNRFEQFSNWFATAIRMYMLDVATNTAHYLSAEKQQVSTAFREQERARAKAEIGITPTLAPQV